MEQGWSEGDEAKIQTTWGEVIEGRVYSFDSTRQLLFIRMSVHCSPDSVEQQSERQQVSFRIIKTSAIQERLEPVPSVKNQLVKLHKVGAKVWSSHATDRRSSLKTERSRSGEENTSKEQEDWKGGYARSPESLQRNRKHVQNPLSSQLTKQLQPNRMARK
jgi:hypothetical protein